MKTGISTVHTRNSVYEIDWDKNLVRRLSGENDPTPRQGPDGVWKHAERIEYVGDGLLFTWEYIGRIGQTTYTSQILKEEQ